MVNSSQITLFCLCLLLGQWVTGEGGWPGPSRWVGVGRVQGEGEGEFRLNTGGSTGGCHQRFLEEMSACKKKPPFLTNRCQIKGCKFEKNAKDNGLFKISRRADVFERWIQLSGKKELLELPIDTLRSSVYFCDLHFEDIQGGEVRKRVTTESLPTVFPYGHTPLCDEAMARWRSSAEYVEYWRCRGKLPSAQPGPPLRCPNLPDNSSAMYCETNGPFTCLYCEGKPLYSEATKSCDSNRKRKVSSGNALALKTGGGNISVLRQSHSSTSLPTQQPSTSRSLPPSITYHRRRDPFSPLQKVEETLPPELISKPSKPVGIRLPPSQDLKPQTMMAVELLKGQGPSQSSCPEISSPLSPVKPSGSGITSYKAKDLKSVSDDWEKEYVLTRIGNRLVAIPCLTSQIKKRKLEKGQE